MKKPVELEVLSIENGSGEASRANTSKLTQLRQADSIPWEGIPVVADQGDRERRRNRRYKVPKIAFRIRIQRALNSAVDLIYQSTLVKVVFGVIPVVSIALIYYVLFHRVELIESDYSAFSELGRVETKLLKIREVWSQEKMSSIAQSVQSVDQRRVFVDYRGLAQWLAEKGEFAEQLDLEFTYTLQPGSLSSIENMLEVPIEVVITTSEESSDQTYLHFLEFMRHMVSSLWYVEIVEATIESEGGGANRMVVMLRVWVHGTVEKHVKIAQQ